MKTILTRLAFIALIVFSVTGCSDDDKLPDVKVSAVNALYAPEDNLLVRLEGKGSVFFEWQAAKSEDNGVVLYDVLFDTAEGDFSNPVYVTTSAGKGFQNTLTLSYEDLTAIAAMAGIEADATGKLKWTVHSSRGLDIVESDVSRTIELERPEEVYIPEQLFLTGTATEGGEDLAAATGLKKTGTATYEIYVALTPGSYQFTDAKTGTPNTYFIEGDKLEENGTATFDGEEGVYRIKLDLNDNSVEVARVEKMELWFAPFGEFLFELPYAGNGSWLAVDEMIEFKQEDWGRDERYKFRMTLVQDGNTLEEWYGSVNNDNSRPDSNTPASYWYMVSVTDDRWNNCFKFAEAVDMHTVNVEVIFNAEVTDYTHEVTVTD